MPRNGKGQKIRAAHDLPYGEVKRLTDAQRELPLADNRQDLSGVPLAGTLDSVLRSAENGPVPQTGGLTRPTERPDEPVTTGMRLGPGAGPEIMKYRQSDPATDVLDMVANVTGDPIVAGLASAARRRQMYRR